MDGDLSARIRPLRQVPPDQCSATERLTAALVPALPRASCLLHYRHVHWPAGDEVRYASGQLWVPDGGLGRGTHERERFTDTRGALPSAML